MFSSPIFNTDTTTVAAETAATLPSIGGTAVVQLPSSTTPVVMAATLPSISGTPVVQSHSSAAPVGIVLSDNFDNEEDEMPMHRTVSSMPVNKL